MRFIVLAVLCASCGTLEVQYDNDNGDSDIIDKGSAVGISALKAVDGDGEVIGDFIEISNTWDINMIKVLHDNIVMDVNVFTGFIYATGFSSLGSHTMVFDNESCDGEKKLKPSDSHIPEELCNGPFPIQMLVGSGPNGGFGEARELYIYGQTASWMAFWRLQEVGGEVEGGYECRQELQSGCIVELIPFETKGFKTPITLEER